MDDCCFNGEEYCKDDESFGDSDACYDTVTMTTTTTTTILTAALIPRMVMMATNVGRLRLV